MDDASFKDGIHLNWAGNDTVAGNIVTAIKYVPKSLFSQPKNIPDLSDSSEFPKLSKKRPAADILKEKMPKFPNQAKKFKTFLPDASSVPITQALPTAACRTGTSGHIVSALPTAPPATDSSPVYTAADSSLAKCPFCSVETNYFFLPGHLSSCHSSQMFHCKAPSSDETLCGLKFLTVLKLRSHLSSHHIVTTYSCDQLAEEGTIILPTDLRVYRCKKCPAGSGQGTFYGSASHLLAEHLSSQHQGEGPGSSCYECRACYLYQLGSERQLMDHIQQIHNKEREGNPELLPHPGPATNNSPGTEFVTLPLSVDPADVRDVTVTNASLSLNGLNQTARPINENPFTTTQQGISEQMKGFRFSEVNSDLFANELPGSFCHSVSKDFEMKRGVAKKFKQVFKELESVKKESALMKGVGGIVTLQDGDRFVYNLITKHHFYQNPISNRNLERCLLKMRTHARTHGVKRINMPRISSGRDGLNWLFVKKMIKEIFKNENLQIFVYYFKQVRASKKQLDCSLDPTVRDQDQSHLTPRGLENREDLRSNENETLMSTENDSTATIKRLKDELIAANDVIGILQNEIGNENFMDTDKLTEYSRNLVKAGKLSFSSIYTVMRDMESELQSQLLANENLTNQLIEAKKFDKLLSEIESLNRKLENVVDERNEDRTSLGDLQERAEALNSACIAIVAMLKDGILSVESRMPVTYCEVRTFL